MRNLARAMAVIVVLAPLARAEAETGNPPAGPAVGFEESAWRQDLQGAKAARNAFGVIGTVGLIGGTALLVSGAAENRSAGDVPGCSVSGEIVLCNTEAGRAEAQSRIDDGKAKATTGLLVGIVGTGFVIGALVKNSKIRNLESDGRNKGFSVQLDPVRPDLVWLRYERSF